MIAGHLAEKKGYWYMILNLHDERGKRKSSFRTLPLTEGIQGVLERERRRRYGDAPPCPGDYISVDESGAPLKPTTCPRGLQSSCKSMD